MPKSLERSNVQLLLKDVFQKLTITTTTLTIMMKSIMMTVSGVLLFTLQPEGLIKRGRK